MLAIWRQVLRVENVTPESDFYDLGGTSLDAMRISAIVTKRFSVRVSIRTLLTEPILGEYCGSVSRVIAASNE